MLAYNFKSQFVEPIRSGKKNTTIRPYRKHPTQIGDTLHLFTGQRTKQCEKIGTYRCVRVQPIMIWPKEMHITLDDVPLLTDAKVELAKTDGFEGLSDFCEFFLNQYGVGPHYMQRITWEPFS